MVKRSQRLECSRCHLIDWATAAGIDRSQCWTARTMPVLLALVALRCRRYLRSPGMEMYMATWLLVCRMYWEMLRCSRSSGRVAFLPYRLPCWCNQGVPCLDTR